MLASTDTVTFDKARAPGENGIEAFNIILPTIKSEIIKSRRHWDLHEPKMWSRAQGISDKDLVDFTIENDLVEVRSCFPLIVMTIALFLPIPRHSYGIWLAHRSEQVQPPMA